MIVELRDHRLWMLARTKKGLSESFLHGPGGDVERPAAVGHSKPERPLFHSPPGFGHLLLVKNGPVEKRLPRRLEPHRLSFHR